jgi:hypothetical protein
MLLGGVGLHKFYLGKPVQGVLYIFFCWTFIPAILGLIEGLNFAFMSDKVFRDRYLPRGTDDAPTPETHVRCPDCRELVRMDARKCKHCGTALVPQIAS